MAELTHIDATGRPRMVDVSDKADTLRTATATGSIAIAPDALALALGGKGPKGAVEGVAEIAGVMAAKRTSELIPLCHPLALTRVTLDFVTAHASRPHVLCEATVETIGPTGVEMEALTAVQVALLTVYDMCKAVDRGMTITDVRVREKHGGKSGSWVAQ